jgi:uncharacterized protein (DUF433 family)
MELPEFLTQSSEGEIRLAGHRIGLYHLIERYNDGESAEMLASRYPSLPLALVHKVLGFYLDNQSDVDAYIAACTAVMDEQQHGSRRLDVNALRRRLASQKPPATEAQVG